MIVVTGHMGFVGKHLLNELRGTIMGIDTKMGEDILSCVLPDPEKVDKVYHLAAQTDAQCYDLAKDAMINIMGTVRLLALYGSKVVLASTSMVNHPVCPYALSKRAAEDYARLHGAAIVRFPNLYGEGGHSVIDRFAEEDVLEIRGSGEQKRTFAHVSIAVTALLTAQPGRLSMVTGKVMSVNDAAAMHPDKPVRHVPASVLDPMEVIQ